jgi:hypothetical protein
MPFYRLAGQGFCFFHAVAELSPFETNAKGGSQDDPFGYSLFEVEHPGLICRINGWVGV